MSVTAQSVIVQALRKVGQMRPGYVPAPELLTDCLIEWQTLVDGWNAKRTLGYTMPDYIYPVTGTGHGSTGNSQTFGGCGYQIGPTATDFVGPRPVAIARMNLLLTTSSPTMPARIPIAQISMEEWMDIPVLQMTAVSVAMVFAYDAQFPNGVIWVWPPLNANSLEIFEWGQLAAPVNLSDAVTLPPGYNAAIVWSLAELFWPFVTHDLAFHKVSLQYMAGKAKLAREAIEAINAPMPRMSCDFQSGRPRVGGGGLDTILTGRPY